MRYELSQMELSNMLTEAAEMGAKRAYIHLGIIKPYMSKAEAFKMYGRANVERWVKEQLIIPIKDGGNSAKWRLCRIRLEMVAKTSNRHTYTPVNER